MRALLSLLLLLLSTAFATAQQRIATVQLEDGKVLVGKVVAMDLARLQIEVDGQVVTLDTGHIASCRFSGGSGEPARSGAPEESGRAPQEPAAPPVRRPVVVDLAEPAEVLVAAALDPEAAPHDLRHRSLLRTRIEMIDAAYPWLCPAAPSQWVSLGMLLFAGTTLVVYLATKVCGVDQASLALCMLLTTWYLGTGFLQVAFVPGSDFATVAMLVGNTVFALFWLRTLFGLTRPASVLAFAVQLGFVLLGFGVLQLADSVLRSIGAAHV